ncbi:MAG: YraN family protein [Planctomycetaceae bacterium]|jgi:putative endonuclease|nr:YraN family protein [Planctomycetaceae bacterium]
MTHRKFSFGLLFDIFFLFSYVWKNFVRPICLPFWLEVPAELNLQRSRSSKSDKPKDKLGRAGEKAAATFLRKLGCRIIARNVLLDGGEIDIVALDGDWLVFVEVKTRSSRQFGLPQDAVTKGKRKRMIRLANQFIQQNNYESNSIRFDIIAITWRKGEKPKIEHLKNAFDAMGN